MADYKYLIIGGGMTADAAVQGIRELDTNGRIGLIGSDPNPPYNRPPLTKGLWKGKPLDSIWRKTQESGAELFLGRTALKIDPDKMLVWDDLGAEYRYEKLLLATGGTPRRLPFGPAGVIYYRTLDDYRQLHALSESHEHFGVIGGGFIGSEISAALAMNGKKASLFFPEHGIGARIYPPEISGYLNEFFRQKGVELHAGVKVKDIRKRDDKYLIFTDNGEQIQVDGVIAGIGIQPEVDLAVKTGVKVDKGILVDDLLHTSLPGIFAAGDVAEFNNPALGKRIRIEHEDNANMMGKQAGRNMAGANEPYRHLAYFYSDLFELGYEAIGELDSRLETFMDWKDEYKKGVIYYLDNGRVRGVLLWNVWDSVPKARALIAEPGPFTLDDLKGRI